MVLGGWIDMAEMKAKKMPQFSLRRPMKPKRHRDDFHGKYQHPQSFVNYFIFIFK
jgi:hypothetical protein